MGTMSVCQARAGFSAVIERAQRGESTVITKRDRVVAKLVPVQALADDGDGSGEDGATDDSVPAVDSLFPSPIGLTCTIQGEVAQILVAARWGRYQREKSANMTEFALTLNIELGVLLNDGDAPRQVERNLTELIRKGVLRPARDEIR